jgi:hypothetical protein
MANAYPKKPGIVYGTEKEYTVVGAANRRKNRQDRFLLQTFNAGCDVKRKKKLPGKNLRCRAKAGNSVEAGKSWLQLRKDYWGRDW